MKLRGLLLILGSLALWAELLAAPAKDSSGSSSSPLSQVSNTGGTNQPEEILSKDKGSILPSEVVVPVPQNDPMLEGNHLPQDQPGSKEAEMATSEDRLASRDPFLPSGEAQLVPTEKLAHDDSPPFEGTHEESTSAEKPRVEPVRSHPLEKNPGLGVGIISGGEPRTGEKPASDIELGSSQFATSSKMPGLRAGPARLSKVLCSGKPASTGKPPSGVTVIAQASPGSDGKPTAGGKPSPSDKPMPGEKPPSGHVTPGKPAVEPAPHGPPASGEKPAAEEPPEKDAAGDSDKESAEEDDSDDDDDGADEEEEVVEEDRNEGDDSLFSHEGSKDSFDDELDYGLQQPPFNSNEYHDWWGGGDTVELEAQPTVEGGGLSEGEGASDDGEPVFDAWGDLVEKKAGPEARSGKPLAETASEEEE